MLTTRLERIDTKSIHRPGQESGGEGDLRDRILSMTNLLETPFGQQTRTIDPQEVESMRKHYAESPQELMTRWSSWRKRARASMQRQLASWALYVLTWDGYPCLDVDPVEGRINPIGLPGWIPQDAIKAHLNRMRGVVQEVISDLLQANALLQVSPRSSSERDRDAARLGTRLVHFYEDKLDRLKMMRALWLALTGNAFVATTWNPHRMGFVLDDNGDRRAQKTGAVDFEFAAPHKLVLEPSAEHVGDSDRLIYECRRSLNYVEEHYPNMLVFLRPSEEDGKIPGVGSESAWTAGDWEANLIYRIETLTIDGSEEYPTHFGAPVGGMETGTESYDGKPFLFRYCYERCHDSRWGEYWWRTVFCGDVLVEHEPYMPRNASGEVLFDDDGSLVAWEQPFSQWKYYEQPLSPWGRGVMRDALPIVRRLWYFDMLLDKQASDASSTHVAVHMSDKITPETRKGVLFIKYSGRTVPTVMNYAGISPDMEKVIRYYEEKLDMVALRNRRLRGQAGSEDSGKKLMVLDELESEGFTPIRRMMNLANSDMYGKALRLSQQMVTERQLIGISENDLSGALAFKGADLKGLSDVRYLLDDLWSMSRMARMARADHWLQLGIIDRAQYMRIIQAGSREDLVDLDELQMENAKRALQHIREMSDDEAKGVVIGVFEARQTVIAALEAQRNPDEIQNPAQEMILVEDVINKVLISVGIGFMDFHDPIVHEDVMRRFQLSSEFEVLSVPKQMLVSLRRRAILHETAKPRLQQAAAEQESTDTRAELSAVQEQRRGLQQAAAAPVGAVA